MIFSYRVSKALAQLGMQPELINPIDRKPSEILARDLHLTPQEAAILIISQIPEGVRKLPNSAPIWVWVKSGRVNTARPDVRSALKRLGWDNLTVEGR